MKKNHFVPVAAIVVAANFFTSSCNNETPAKETAAKEDATTLTTPAAITNPNFGIAPVEYAELSEKAMNYIAKFEFDAWADMLADDVVFSFPDGDVDTRTKLEGKAAVVGWWKNWRKTSGIESMTMTEFNHFPLDVTAQPKGGALKGIYDFAYFSSKMVYNGNSVSLRMNFITHFNADKKIDRYTTYYDRTLLVKATGKNILEKK